MLKAGRGMIIRDLFKMFSATDFLIIQIIIGFMFLIWMVWND
jgi:hypothetical protein